jgi:hypothetical protein
MIFGARNAAPITFIPTRLISKKPFKIESKTARITSAGEERRALSKGDPDGLDKRHWRMPDL